MMDSKSSSEIIQTTGTPFRVTRTRWWVVRAPARTAGRGGEWFCPGTGEVTPAWVPGTKEETEMQFYRDGYRPGDPDVLPASPQAAANTGRLPAEVDVLIVGTGPAGTVLGAQLAAFPGLRTRIVERRAGPLEVGRADGVACRTVEMFQAFGLADALLREAYWVNEVRFWGPSEADRSRIVRTGWVEDTPDGLSEFPHVIVNQARMQQYLLDHMARSASRLTPDYGVEFAGLEIGAGDHPVAVTLRGPDNAEFTVRAKYVVGCDGARSAVRQSIGRELHGDSASHAWGVMDVLAVTDFPDWRTKNVIQSAGKGSLLMIPREGGNLVRCYVDLGEVAATTPGGSAAPRRSGSSRWPTASCTLTQWTCGQWPGRRSTKWASGSPTSSTT